MYLWNLGIWQTDFLSLGNNACIFKICKHSLTKWSKRRWYLRNGRPLFILKLPTASFCSLIREQPEFRPQGTERVVVHKKIPRKLNDRLVFNEEKTVLRGDICLGYPAGISSWEMATLKATNLCWCVGGRVEEWRLLLKYECPKAKCHHPLAKGPESKNIDRVAAWVVSDAGPR